MSDNESILETKIAEDKSSFSVKDLCIVAVFTAIICVLSQLSIPMPAGVPMTLQTFIIPVAGIILGKKKGTYATLLYLLMGAIGIPVFAGFTGGFDKLFGMTGGFLISFPVLSFTAGLGDELGLRFSKDKNNKKAFYFAILMAMLLIGATINYAFGTVWFMAFTKSTFMYAFTACVLPFIVTALIKIVLVAIIAPQLRKRLNKALA